jgi:hypothetical protein
MITRQKNDSVIGYSFFALAIFGLALSFIRREKLFMAFVPFFLVPFVFLMNHTPPFEQFFNLISQAAIFSEALRFVFTKFSVLFLFGLAVYLAFGLAFLAKLIRRENLEKISFSFFISRW